MKPAVFCKMARRRKSKEGAVFEAVTGIAGLVLFLWFFVPGFRQLALFSLAIFAAVCVVLLIVWMVYSTIKPEPDSPTFRTFTSAPYQTERSIHRNQPAGAVEELRPVEHPPEPTISEKLRKIDWFQFEKLIELIYQHKGYTVERSGGANPDGGIDLIVESPDGKYAIQCKQWRRWTVGVKQIREFLGALTDSQISNGIYITLVGYTYAAKNMADKHGIQILNETDLIEMIETSGHLDSKEICALFSDERKFCPKCEDEMVLRTSRLKGNQFWGCSNYPRCRFILNIEA
jgi:hypothetical protein